MVERQNTLGTVIKSIRKARRITQKELSKLTGFSQNTISNHENGNRKIDLNDLHIYAEKLNVSYNLIIRFSEDLFHNGYSKALDQFQDFQKIYNYFLKAYYNEADIYFYSIDEYKETLEILDILKNSNIDINSVSYEYIKKLCIEILHKNDNNQNKKSEAVSLEEIVAFSTDYIEFMRKAETNKNNINAEALIKEAEILKQKSLKISERLYHYPNYSYEAIKGKPMYLVYKETYPKSLDEFIEQFKNC